MCSLYLILLFGAVLFSPVYCTNEICFLPSCAPDHQLQFIGSCSLSEGHIIQGRCCCNASNNDTIIALDLSSCSLDNINGLIRDQAPSVIRLNLHDNPNLNYSETDFESLVHLHTIKLPLHLQCPGANQWFNSTWNAWQRITSTHSTTSCFNQSDTCSYLQHKHNYTCPVNSACHNNGPGQFQCLCKEGWHGYKCLRLSEQPPYLYVIIGSSSASMVLSFIVWSTQRRFVIS